METVDHLPEPTFTHPQGDLGPFGDRDVFHRGCKPDHHAVLVGDGAAGASDPAGFTVEAGYPEFLLYGFAGFCPNRRRQRTRQVFGL